MRTWRRFTCCWSSFCPTTITELNSILILLYSTVYQSKLNAADWTREQQNISNELQKLQTGEVSFKYFYSKYCKITQMYLKWAIKGSNSCIPHFCRNLEYFRSELYLSIFTVISFLTLFISYNCRYSQETEAQNPHRLHFSKLKKATADGSAKSGELLRAKTRGELQRASWPGFITGEKVSDRRISLRPAYKPPTDDGPPLSPTARLFPRPTRARPFPAVDRSRSVCRCFIQFVEITSVTRA